MPSCAIRKDGRLAHVLPGEADRARARRRQPHDGADGRGLAHAVAAHQRHHLAGLDRQRQAEQHLAQAVAGLDAVDFEQRSPLSAMAGHRMLLAEIGALDLFVLADRGRRRRRR